MRLVCVLSDHCFFRIVWQRIRLALAGVPVGFHVLTLVLGYISSIKLELVLAYTC
jgi:hypothetical protein